MIASRVIEYMEAELAGPLASEFAGFDLINGAGRLMESLFEWKYLTKTARTLTLRASVTGSAASYTASSGTLTKAAAGLFASYALVPGDHVELHDGSTLLGRFNVVTRASDDSITIDAPSLTADITGTVGFTVDTARIALPTDVERISAVFRGRPNSGGAFASDSVELEELDASYITGSSYVTGYTLEWGTATAKAVPVPVLRVWPPRTSEDVDALSCVYKRAWPEITGEDDAIPIPPFMNSLFIEICRAYAVSFEDQVQLDAAIAGIEAGTTFRAASKYDAGGMRFLGTVRQGAVRRRSPDVSEHSANFVHNHLQQ